MSLEGQGCYEFGRFRLDPAQQQLLEDGHPVSLTPKAFDTLLVLVENHGRLVRKEELLQKVWPDAFVEESTLAQNVFRLRKLLGNGDGSSSLYIETIPKRGYRFVATVRVEETSANANQLERTTDARTQHARTVTWRGWIAAGIAAVLITAGALVHLRNRPTAFRTAPKSDRVMLVVLPVQNLTGDASQEYLADGLTEEVIADLGSLNPQRLGVIARTSAMAYKQKNKTVQEIARELGVNYVLETSLRTGPGQVRFTAQLIRTQDQTHMWAHNYDRPMTNVLALQGELAHAVAEEIRIGLTPEVAARLASPRAVQPEAYDAYLKGRFYWNKRTLEAMTAAESYFHQAIKADSNFALGYAGLADCYQVMVNLEQLKAEDAYPLARAAALKALELDNTLAEAHTSIASIKGDFDWDWQGAETEYKQALALNPNYATAHHWYGDFLAGMGRYADSAEEIRKAQELDPLSPVIGVTLAQLYCSTGHCERGIEQLKKTLIIDPDFAEAHEALAQIYAHLGMYQQALAEMEKERRAPTGHLELLVGYASAKAGHKEEALSVVRQLEKQSDFQHRDYYLSIMYGALGDKDQAFVRLESARQSHDPFMPYFRADITLASLRSDPRYADLYRRMNMPR
jgi:TolB-like protein/DNA-binding winged helix-turn-helix (wHTH) protein/Tfp pilus assembly protein PilF